MATTLFCALVGVKAKFFPVEIDDNTSVGAMKQAIKKEKASVIMCGADELQLYLAKKTGDTAWLKDNDEVAIQLESGVVSDSVKAIVEGEELKATRGIWQWLSEKHMPTPMLSEIHIVVELPPKPMVTLFCSLVGVKSNAFPVEIKSQASVAALATAIAKAKPNALECDPDELQLYLAKRGGVWLKDDDKAAVDLKKGRMNGNIQAMVGEDKEMASTWSVQESLDAEHLPSPGRRAIHILVVAPAPTKSLKWKRKGDEEEGGGVKKAKSGHKSEGEEEEENDDDGDDEEGKPWLCINEMRVYTKHPCICEQYRAATGRG